MQINVHVVVKVQSYKDRTITDKVVVYQQLFFKQNGNKHDFFRNKMFTDTCIYVHRVLAFAKRSAPVYIGVDFVFLVLYIYVFIVCLGSV